MVTLKKKVAGFLSRVLSTDTLKTKFRVGDMVRLRALGYTAEVLMVMRLDGEIVYELYVYVPSGENYRTTYSEVFLSKEV